MMNEAKVANPNDFKVVSFHNKEEFGFTPDMGCMYDGRGINGVNGSPGIDAGEKIVLPYHIAQQLATNLAKASLLRTAPTVDPQGIPTGVPLWDTVKLESLKNSYLADLYSEAKPIAQTETDKLLAKVEELNKFVMENIPAKTPKVEETAEKTAPQSEKVYLDKQEVIAELEKRGIKHDKRSTKDTLEKLLA